LLGVESAERLHCTPVKRKVAHVAVLERPDVGAKVKCNAGEHQLGEGTLEFGEAV
jgi:hypothetical protein